MANISFTTSAVTSPQKLDAWRDALSLAFGPIEVDRKSEENFTGSVRSYSRAQLQFNELHYRGQKLERTAGNIAKFDQEYFTFGRPVSGPLFLNQGGHEFTIEPGSLILLNQCVPYTAVTDVGYHAFSISIPRALLLQRAPDIGAFYQLSINDGSPRGQLLANFTKHMEDGITGWSEAEAIFLREQMLDLIVMLMVNDKDSHSSAYETSVKAAHRERAIAYIKNNHCDPQLHPKTIAAACSISVNYLHKLFHGAELQVESYIYLQRLETCRNLLLDPLHRDKTMQQIAYRAGFSHPSHFSRLFKQKFGMSPTEYKNSQSTLADVAPLPLKKSIV